MSQRSHWQLNKSPFHLQVMSPQWVPPLAEWCHWATHKSHLVPSHLNPGHHYWSSNQLSCYLSHYPVVEIATTTPAQGAPMLLSDKPLLMNCVSVSLNWPPLIAVYCASINCQLASALRHTKVAKNSTAVSQQAMNLVDKLLSSEPLSCRFVARCDAPT